MPKTQTTNPHPVIKILSDLNLLPEKGEDVNEKSYLRALMEGVNILSIESLSRPGRSDPRIKILQDEVRRVRSNRKAADPKFKEKRTTIKGDKFMGKEPKKDAPPTADKPKLLTGVGNFKSDDVKPVDVDKNDEDKSSGLNPDRLNDIAKTVESIALLLRRQLGLEKKQQRDTKKQQDKLNKEARESELESKPDKKTGLIPKSIATPTLNFFDRLKNFFINIAIGSVALKLFDWLNDPNNKDKIEKFEKWISENAPLIVGGLAAIALLPVLSSLVGLVGGIMGGLSMLGLSIPILPLILKGILIAAVAALSIAAVNWFAKKIVGGEGFKRSRQLNLQLLERQGMTKSGDVKDEKGVTIRAPIFGENSLTGREWREDDTLWAGPNETAKVNLIKGTISKTDGLTTITPKQHQEWYATNYGEEALDAKLGAHAKYTTTLEAIKSKQKEMEARVKEEILTEKERQAIASESSGLTVGFFGGLRNPNKYRGEDYNERVILHRQIITDLKRENINIETRIRDEYNREAMEIFNKSKGDNEELNFNSSSLNQNNKDDQLVSSLQRNDLGAKIVLIPGDKGTNGVVGGGNDSGPGDDFGGSATDSNNHEGILTQLKVGAIG